MGLKSYQWRYLYFKVKRISLIVDWSFGCNMFVERYVFTAKEKSVYKIYPTEVVFPFNNVST